MKKDIEESKKKIIPPSFHDDSEDEEECEGLVLDADSSDTMFGLLNLIMIGMKTIIESNPKMQKAFERNVEQFKADCEKEECEGEH